MKMEHPISWNATFRATVGGTEVEVTHTTIESPDAMEDFISAGFGTGFAPEEVVAQMKRMEAEADPVPGDVQQGMVELDLHLPFTMVPMPGKYPGIETRVTVEPVFDVTCPDDISELIS